MTSSGEDRSPKKVCLITTPKEDSIRIAKAIVEQKLAACVNIVPFVQSIYWWEGAIEEEEESLLIVKTTEAALPALTDAVRAIHPYDTFELITLTIDGGNGPYLDWIGSSVVLR